MTASRRRWSYSLRTLLIVVALCAVVAPVTISMYGKWQAEQRRQRNVLNSKKLGTALLNMPPAAPTAPAGRP